MLFKKLLLLSISFLTLTAISYSQPLPKELTPKGKPQLIVLEFTAPWCLSCKKADPMINNLKKQYGQKLYIKRFNVEHTESQKWMEQYHIEAIPTFIFYKQLNKPVKRIETELPPEKLKKEIQAFLK